LVLQQGEKALRELSACRKSIPTEVLQVRKDHIRQLITQISKSTAHAESHVERLYQELNRYLQERPAVGTEKRFHKEPFSFRVCVGLKRVFVYPIGPFLGGGEYKTAKASWRAEISSDRIAIEKQMMSRSRHQEPEDIKMHHAILKIPGAEKYFVELPRRHAGYFGSNGKMKWEAHRSLYHDSLDVVINRQGLYTDPSDRESFLPLTMQDFISFLKNTIQGVDLIRQHRISHGDIKLSNIGIFVGPEKSCTSRITDFDWSSYFPAQLPADSDTYVYWDARRRTLGEVSEKTDLYGLVLLVSSVFLIGVQQQLAMEGDKTIHEMFQRICENPKEEKKEFLKKHLKSLETIGLKVNGPLAKESCGVIFEKIKSWQNTANHRRSLFLKAWLCKSLCFDRVFSLLEQALKADQKDSTFAYPTTQDIQNVLDACQQDAMWIDEQCK
jgi:serine/threonine protein kinase